MARLAPYARFVLKAVVTHADDTIFTFANVIVFLLADARATILALTQIDGIVLAIAYGTVRSLACAFYADGTRAESFRCFSNAW